MTEYQYNRRYRNLFTAGYSKSDAFAIMRAELHGELNVAESPIDQMPPVIEREGNLAVIEKPGLALMGGGASVWLSWKPATNLERAVVLAAMTGEIPKLSSTANMTIRVANIGRKHVQVVNVDTGEVKDAIRTVLFTDDGKAYSSVSEGIDGCLRAICSLWQPPPWNPPLPLRMRQHELSGAKRFYTLEYDSSSVLEPDYKNRKK